MLIDVVEVVRREEMVVGRLVGWLAQTGREVAFEMIVVRLTSKVAYSP